MQILDVKDLLSSVPNLTGRHLLTLDDFTEEEVNGILDVAIELKRWFRNDTTRKEASELQPLLGRSVALIFQKRSTRTRLSMETGISKLGGLPIFLGSDDIQLGVNESLSDSARVISRFNDVIAARVFGHHSVEELASLSTVPVVNMLSDKFHPLQLLADMMTLREYYGSDDTKGRTIAYVGDGNNMAHSFVVTSPKLGYNLRVATPNGFSTLNDVQEMGFKEAKAKGTEILFTEDPQEAVEGADVIVTDTVRPDHFLSSLFSLSLSLSLSPTPHTHTHTYTEPVDFYGTRI
jgi:ornithine carbamoyltransferase